MVETPTREAQCNTSCVFIVFGAMGHLMQRFLLPSICDLVAASEVGNGFRLVGVAKGIGVMKT